MIVRNKKKQAKRLNGIFTTISPTSPFPWTYEDLPPDQDDWNCAMWDSYYERNRVAGGAKEAFQIFEMDTSRVGFFANLELCKFDCTFSNKYRDLGFNMTFLTDIYCAGEDIISGGAEVISDVTKGATGVSKIAKFAPWILLGGTALYFRKDIAKAFK